MDIFHNFEKDTKYIIPGGSLILFETTPMLLITYWNQKTKTTWEQLAIASFSFGVVNFFWTLFSIIKTIYTMGKTWIRTFLASFFGTMCLIVAALSVGFSLYLS